MDQAVILLFPFFMILAGAGDVMTRRIPNVLIGGMCLVFFPVAVLAGVDSWGLLQHVSTAIVLLTFGFGLFSVGYIGGGDAKLITTAGLWLGFPAVLPFLALSALAGGVLAACTALFYMVHIEVGTWNSRAERAFQSARPDIPYGFALAAGAILATPLSWMVHVAPH